MTKTYTQILKQIADLKAQAENVRRKEIGGVVNRIREAIQHYGLTAGDLGLGAGGSSAAPKAARKKPGRKPGHPAALAVIYVRRRVPGKRRAPQPVLSVVDVGVRADGRQVAYRIVLNPQWVVLHPVVGLKPTRRPRRETPR